MEPSSLGLTIGIPPDTAKRLRAENGSNDKNEMELSSLVLDEIPSAGPLQVEHDKMLPCIVIDSEKFIGYTPSDDKELKLTHTQLIEAMWARYEQSNSDGILETKKEKEEPPPDFDLQVIDLFATGAAKYSDKPMITKGKLNLPYPTFLQSAVTGQQISTRSLVDEIRRPAPSDFLSELWDALRMCSRGLFWKKEMAEELRSLFREEEARIEYAEWTESKRQAKLDNLYSIRETLVHQVDLAKAKVTELEDEREIQVKEAISPFQRKFLESQTSSIEEFGTTELSFPDEFQWLGLRDEPIDEEDDWGLEHSDSDSYNNYSDRSLLDDASTARIELEDDGGASSDEDAVEDSAERKSDIPGTSLVVEASEKIDNDPLEHKNQDEKVESSTTHPNAPVLSLPFAKRKKRRERSKRRMQEERKAAARKDRERALHQLETDLRIKLTTKELILAQTMDKALEEKMIKVEELLDSLQDEVWQAVEEAENQVKGNALGYDSKDQSGFSLLDQILAMILGSTPIPDEMPTERHFQNMQDLHNSVIKKWRAKFGRLPAAVGVSNDIDSHSSRKIARTPSPTSEDLRKMIGLTDNKHDDWESIEDWDELLGNQEESAQKPEKKISTKGNTEKQNSTNRTKLIGLRPGGHLVRLE